jgi:DNA repair photolyase
MHTSPVSFLQKGRGATFNPVGRFETRSTEVVDDGWLSSADELFATSSKTIVHNEVAKSIISKNDSPDIPFDQSVNPYRGCEHGCPYCYARPSHATLNLSPGLDFETKLFAKSNAAELLATALRVRGYKPSPINFGANTDPYQPIEKKRELTRACIAVLAEANHPLTIITKNAMVTRDIDLLAPMAEKKLVRAIEQLSAAGIPTSVLIAPVIPFINDEWLERVLEAARQAGAVSAGYGVIRLPLEVNEIFQTWLNTHFPHRAAHVMARIRDMRDGKDNVSTFGERMKGTGLYAELIKKRFEVARTRLGFLPRSIAGSSERQARRALRSRYRCFSETTTVSPASKVMQGYCACASNVFGFGLAAWAWARART